MEVMRVTCPGSDGWAIDAFVGPVDGKYEVVGITIRSFDFKDSAPIDQVEGDELRRLTSSDVRRQPLGEVLHDAPLYVGAEVFRALKSIVDETANIDDPQLQERVLDHLESAVEADSSTFGRRSGRPPLYGLDHFQSVAEVYREAEAAGLPPTRTVAERKQVSRTAAAKWVARCRALGLLGPAPSRGRRGEAVTLGDRDPI